MRDILEGKPAGTLVIIDEVTKVPELLDEVHWLMVNKGMQFVLCASSARKLKKSSSNTLGGRAVPIPFYHPASAEITDFDAFERFLEVAAISDGEILNYEIIATDCGVSAKTVASYFQILYDTLIGYKVPAYRKVIQRKLVVQEIIAYLGYGGSKERLTYWRTYTGLEVDAVLGEAKVAVEITSVEEIKTQAQER